MHEVTHTYEVGADRQVNASDLLEATRTAKERFDYDYHASLTRSRHIPNLDIVFTAINSVKNLNGVPYYFDVKPDDSLTDAIVLHAPWSTSVTPHGDPDKISAYLLQPESFKKKPFNSNSWNMATRAMYLRYALGEAQVRDSEGRELPIIAVGSLAVDRRGVNKFATKRENRDADFIVPAMAESVIEICDNHSFGRLRLVGASLGGAVMGELIRRADNFDIESLLIAEPPNFKKRSLGQFAMDYAKDESDRELVGSWIDDAPLLRRALAEGGDGWDARNVYSNGNLRSNLFALSKAMSEDSLFFILNTAHRKNIATSIYYGEHSRVTAGIQQYLNNSKTAAKIYENGLLKIFNGVGKGAIHGSCENQNLFVDMVLRSTV